MNKRNSIRVLMIICCAAFLSACAGRIGPPPSEGDCITARLWSNGWHANLALPASAFEDDHPFRELFPDAEYFLVGWGERGFYMAEDAGFFKGLAAILPPSPSVMQVIANETPVEESLWRPRDLVEFAMSETGAKRMTDEIAAGLAYGPDGAPVVLASGRVEGASMFVASTGSFHLFNMCNHWTARRLREAGVPVHPALSFTAPGLMRAVERKSPKKCPAGSRKDEIV